MAEGSGTGNDNGGIALRMPLFNPASTCRPLDVEGALAAFEWDGICGKARLIVRGHMLGLEQIRATLDFTPRNDLSFAQLPRDLVPFGPEGLPTEAVVTIEARQRKLNTGLLYFTLKRPDLGKVLYIQNLSAPNWGTGPR